MRDQGEHVEALLTRLFTDAEFRLRFMRAPVEVAKEWGLADEAAEEFASADLVGLELAARSYARKRGVG